AKGSKGGGKFAPKGGTDIPRDPKTITKPNKLPVVTKPNRVPSLRKPSPTAKILKQLPRTSQPKTKNVGQFAFTIPPEKPQSSGIGLDTPNNNYNAKEILSHARSVVESLGYDPRKVSIKVKDLEFVLDGKKHFAAAAAQLE